MLTYAWAHMRVPRDWLAQSVRNGWKADVQLCAAAGAAAAMLIAQPCLAASDLRDAGAAERRTSAFAGVRLRVPMGNPERPSARLQLTTFHVYRDASGVTVRSISVQQYFLERAPLVHPVFNKLH